MKQALRQYLRLLWPFFAILLALAALLAIPYDRIGTATIETPEQNLVLKGELPFHASALGDSTGHIFSFNLYHYAWHGGLYHINADNCLNSLEINGTLADLSGIPPSDLCNWKRGFELDLGPLLKAGDNEVVARLSGANHSLRFYPVVAVLGHPGLYRSLIVIAMAYLAGIAFFTRELHNDRLFAAFFLTCLAIAARLPYLFWHLYLVDETTFITMGRHVLEGHLPYVGLWDNKPPLLFYLFALMILLGGGTVVGIHLVGALAIALTGWLCYIAGRRICDTAAGWFCGIFYILTATTTNMGQVITTDHLAALPMAMVFLLCIDDRRTAWRAAKIGLLTGIAAMIQTNYWFGIFPLAALVALQAWQRPLAALRDGLICGLASAIPFALFMLLYWSQGEAATLWRSVVMTGISFRHLSPSPLNLLGSFGNAISVANAGWMMMLKRQPMIVTLAAAGLLFINALQKVRRRDRVVLVAFYFTIHLISGYRATNISVLPHYMLALVISNVLVAGVMFSQVARYLNMLTIAVAMYATSVLCTPLYTAYSQLLTTVAAGESPSNDRYTRIAGIINKGPVPHPYIYVCNSLQILYFLTHSAYPTPIAHSDLVSWLWLSGQAYGHPVNLHSIFNDVKRHNPSYIIGSRNARCFADLGQYMENYDRIFYDGRHEVWRIKQTRP